VKDSKKKNKPHKKAPNWMFRLLRWTLGPILKRKYKYRFNLATSKGIKRPCFILCNHQAGYDQFAVGLGFKFGINFVARVSLFKHGLKSHLMQKLTRPIPFNRGSSDPAAIKAMMQVIADGGAVGIFPEGNRSFFGETMRIQPGTARLAKKLNVPLVLCRIRGGYLTKARWRVEKNRGGSSGEVVRVVSPEELQALSAEELEAIIKESLYVNEFEYSREAKIAYNGRARAENLESILFHCPVCNGLDTLHSEKHDLWCKACGTRTTLNKYMFFETQCGIARKKLTERQNNVLQAANEEQLQEQSCSGGVEAKAVQLPETILDWSKLQIEFIKSYNFAQHIDTPVFVNKNVEFSQDVSEEGKREKQPAQLELYADRIRISAGGINAAVHEVYLKDIAVILMQEVRRITFHTRKEAFVIDAPIKTNLLKYMMCGYHIKNTAEQKEEYYGF